MLLNELSAPLCWRCGSETELIHLRATYRVDMSRQMEFVPHDSVYRFRCLNESCRLLIDRTGDGRPCHGEPWQSAQKDTRERVRFAGIAMPEITQNSRQHLPSN